MRPAEDTDERERDGPDAPSSDRIAELCAQILSGIRDHAVFMLDVEGRIRMWNRGAEQLSGYEPKEVIGKSYALFGPSENGAGVDRILQSARDAGSFQQERWWRRRDGGLVLVDELISPLDGAGFLVITRDLTDRIELEERRANSRSGQGGAHSGERALRAELQAAERRASFLAEASSILVATSLDFDSTIKALARLAVSRLADWCVIHAFDKQNRLQRAEIAHRDPQREDSLEKAVSGALSQRWNQALRSMLQTGQAQIFDRFAVHSWFDNAGEELLEGVDRASVMVAPLLGRGTVLGTITFVSIDPGRDYDEEDLGLAEELGRRAAIALDNARLYREAQEANRAKADFLAVISHELRTPLNAIMGYSDLLDAEVTGELSDRQRRQVGRIRASARHLLQLIEEILSYARMEAGGEELHVEDADAAGIVPEAAAVIEPMAQSRALELRVDPGSTPIPLHTDAGKVRQILANLLSNAVKFTERGHVELRVEADGDDVVFHVIDTGIGIPEADLARVFDPFWQVEQPNTRRVGGTGLGLSVSRRFARLLQGRIEIRSEPGRGTHVRVRLPRRLRSES